MLNKQQINDVMNKMMNEIGEVGESLDSRSDFQYLISIILSAQTTDKAVNKVTKELFNKYPDAKALSQASVTDVEKIIHSIGLYHQKAVNIINCSKELDQRFNGIVPKNRKDIMTLPGAGRKTANVFLSDRTDTPAFAVDTHVEAIAKRMHFVENNASLKAVEDKFTDTLDSKIWNRAHHTLIEFGRKYNIREKNSDNFSDLVLYADKLNEQNKKA